MQGADSRTKLQASGGAGPEFGSFVSPGVLVPPDGPRLPTVPCQLIGPLPIGALEGTDEARRQTAGHQTFYVMVLPGNVIPSSISQEPLEDDIFVFHE